jgi:signal transduction histidine kinase
MLESRGTTEFLTEKSPIWGYFSFAHNDIFWYTSQTAHGSRGEMWLNINIVIEAMAQAILALVFLMLVLFFGARSWIKKSANSISQPLSDLALAADELEEPQLPMAKKPEEVRQLTKSFNGLLERLNRKIEQEQQFVSDASHELRTPLAAIRGHVTLLKRRWHEHPEIVDDSLSYIDEESMRMKRLIEELLLISRGTHLKRDEECFDLNEFTDRTVREIQPALTQQVSFERGQALMITSDKNALHHILIAFLENAGKYAPADTKISVALTQNEDEIDLTITDEGPGIPDDEKEKVFERFYRVDKSRSSEIPGTGLGLSIAKQYAELNKAEAFVTDNQPKGSIFHLKLKK